MLQRFNYWNNKRILFLHHRFEDNSYYGYKPTEFYLDFTESDYAFENTVCDIASNKKIETYEFYNMYEKNTVDITKRCIRIKFHCTVENVTLTLHFTVNIQ